uniref:Uncharacterized protein n=1 Tax=Anguilla anguilla TaxID=7936 RepID=A0A0E9QJN6_ANGAN
MMKLECNFQDGIYFFFFILFDPGKTYYWPIRSDDRTVTWPKTISLWPRSSDHSLLWSPASLA